MPFVFLVTALLFARSGLYGRREARPGLPGDRRRACSRRRSCRSVYALVNGLDFSSYYIFYGGLFFALIWVSGLRWLYERGTGARAARARPHAGARSWSAPGKQIDAVAHALLGDGTATRYEPVGYISLTPKPDNGLRNLGALDDLPQLLDRAPRAGGDHRRPRLPAGGGVRRSSTAATSAASRCGSPPRRWRS